MKKPYVNFEVDKKIATIEFFHPAHNALPLSLLSKLAATIEKLGANAEINLIILKSAGNRTFCAGANFDELIALKNIDEARSFFMGFALVIKAIKSAEIPIVTSVQGKAVGGAVGLIAASDYTVANPYATFKLSELSLGIGPFVIAPAIQDKVGMAAYNKMMLEPMSWQGAEWGIQVGLYSHLVKTQKQQQEYIAYFVDHYRQYNRESIVANKRLTLIRKNEELLHQMTNNASITANFVLKQYTQTKLKKFLSKNNT